MPSSHNTPCSTEACSKTERIIGAVTHGMTKTTTYNVWVNMRQRCNNTENPRYVDYGGRGIRVCDRWETFENFLADMGIRPLGMTLERRDNDGHYEPGNCRWSTTEEQANNKRNNNRLTYQGETLTISEWARKLGVRDQLLRVRLCRGWSVEETLGRPPVPNDKTRSNKKRQVT